MDPREQVSSKSNTKSTILRVIEEIITTEILRVIEEIVTEIEIRQVVTSLSDGQRRKNADGLGHPAWPAEEDFPAVKSCYFESDAESPPLRESQYLRSPSVTRARGLPDKHTSTWLCLC